MSVNCGSTASDFERERRMSIKRGFERHADCGFTASIFFSRGMSVERRVRLARTDADELRIHRVRFRGGV